MTDFSQPWDLSDVVFVVEGKRVHGNKTILASWSPVMKVMLFGEFKEKHLSEIELPKKSFEAVVELMGLLHPPNKLLNDNNIDMLLPLAREYQIDSLLTRCECFLRRRPASINLYLVAEENGFENIKEKCIEWLKGRKFREICKDVDFPRLSSKTQVELLKDKGLQLEEFNDEVEEIVKGRRQGGLLCGSSRNQSSTSASGPTRKLSIPHNTGKKKECHECTMYMVEKINARMKIAP